MSSLFQALNSVSELYHEMNFEGLTEVWDGIPIEIRHFTILAIAVIVGYLGFQSERVMVRLSLLTAAALIFFYSVELALGRI